MAKTKYNIYVIIDRDETNLDPQNLAPWGVFEQDRQLKVGQPFSVGYFNGEIALAIIFFRIVKIEKTDDVDKLIMTETGRKDF